MKDQDQGQNIMGCRGEERGSFQSHHHQLPTDLNSGHQRLDCGVFLSRMGMVGKGDQGRWVSRVMARGSRRRGELERGAKVLALFSQGGELLERSHQGKENS